jgi:hypothetical protein
MITTPGAQITVRVYPNIRARDSATDWTDVRVSIVSAGPPGVVGDWARTLEKPDRWLLVRKSKNTGATYEAIEGDMGRFG